MTLMSFIRTIEEGNKHAGLAQIKVEQITCNNQVGGSSPPSSTKLFMEKHVQNILKMEKSTTP